MRSSRIASTSRMVMIVLGSMPSVTVEGGGSMTKVPMPWRVSTSPAACRCEMASRTTVRDTPMMRMISDSVGSLSPGVRRPWRILSEIWATTPWARLRCFLGGAEGGGEEFMGAV
jgi:hypothetical protein